MEAFRLFSPCVPWSIFLLDNLNLPVGKSYAEQFKLLSYLTVGALKELSLQNITCLENRDIDMVLRTFWNAKQDRPHGVG